MFALFELVNARIKEHTVDMLYIEWVSKSEWVRGQCHKIIFMGPKTKPASLDNGRKCVNNNAVTDGEFSNK